MADCLGPPGSGCWSPVSSGWRRGVMAWTQVQRERRIDEEDLLRRTGVQVLTGVDVLPEAAEAVLRDRPGVYLPVHLR